MYRRSESGAWVGTHALEGPSWGLNKAIPKKVKAFFGLSANRWVWEKAVEVHFVTAYTAYTAVIFSVIPAVLELTMEGEAPIAPE